MTPHFDATGIPAQSASAWPGPKKEEPECGSFAGSGMATGEQQEASRPLRIISVGPCLVRGGAEQWLINLARFLDPRRVKLVRAIATNPKFVDPAFVADVPVPIEIGQAEAVRRAAKECDALVCWGIELDGWLADCRPKRCIFIAHGEGRWTRKLLESSAGVVDQVVAVSRRVQRSVCQGFSSTVIYNGVDSARLGQTQSRGEVRRSLGFHPNDFVLGYVGRFSGEKHAERVIDAVAELPPHFKALLVGWGAQRAALLDRANARIPGRYAFVTACDYLGDYYRAMDAFCLLSSEEGHALVLLEAMLCGLPLIVTPVGSVSELIVHRLNGVIVSGQPRAVAAAALQLRRYPHWARGMAAEGQAYAEKHGHARRMARQYEDLLVRLCGARG